jgi:hypothetical protein
MSTSDLEAVLTYICGLTPEARTQFKLFAAQAKQTGMSRTGLWLCEEFETLRTTALELCNTDSKVAEAAAKDVEETPEPVPKVRPSIHCGFSVMTPHHQSRVDRFITELYAGSTQLSDAAVANALAKNARGDYLQYSPHIHSMTAVLQHEMNNKFMWDQWEADRNDFLVQSWLKEYVIPLYGRVSHYHMDRTAAATSPSQKIEHWHDLIVVALSCKKLLATSPAMSKIRNRLTLKAIEFLCNHGLVSAFLCIAELWPEMIARDSHPSLRLKHSQARIAEIKAIMNRPVLREALERQMAVDIPAGLRLYILDAPRTHWEWNRTWAEDDDA